jgi:UDP-N-acetylmuramyl pentapeptide phosphotransferase/UDP-N-acetylglucosamine-1-phosphate transferase
MDLPVGVQKVHATPTPRVGGIAVYLALLIARTELRRPEVLDILDTVLVAGLPALVIGLLEDITKRAGVRLRLAATIVSGLLASWMGGVKLTHLDVPLLDSLLTAAPLAWVATAIAVGGVANAINMIDGFHGLASGVTTIALLAIAAVAASVGDSSLALTAVVLAAAVAGFWLVNFPWGKLFLGDGGAYFAGFALAWLAVLLPMRNPAVSPWASLLICGYPVIEALYSIARRCFSRRSPGQADGAHLHSLIASRFVRRRLRGVDPALQNPAVSVLMWICAAIPALLGVTFRASTLWLALGALACALLYHWLYRQVARS